MMQAALCSRRSPLWLNHMNENAASAAQLPMTPT
jgi:hypothetical protein